MEEDYYWRLRLRNAVLYQYALKSGINYIIHQGYALPECAMTEEVAKNTLGSDFELFEKIAIKKGFVYATNPQSN